MNSIEIRIISSGTIATLAGIHRYDQIDALQMQWACWAWWTNRKHTSTVGQAWLDFCAAHPVLDQPAQLPVAQTVTFNSPRPTHVQTADAQEALPEQWVVFNAPRPLYGDLTWEAVGPTGRHYAAIDGSTVHASWMYEANLRDRAVIVQYESSS